MNGTKDKDCPRCRELAARVAELEQQVADLLRKLEEVQRSTKRQTVRFPRRKRVEQPKKPGRKKGHRAEARAMPEKVDREIDVPVGVCPDCNVSLQEIRTHTQYQTDIPKVEPTVTQFNVQVGICPCCGKRVQGRHDEQTSDALGAAAHSLGPNAHAMAASLKHGAGMSYDKIRRFLWESFELRCTASTFIRAGQRLARRARPTFDRLRSIPDSIQADPRGRNRLAGAAA